MQCEFAKFVCVGLKKKMTENGKKVWRTASASLFIMLTWMQLDGIWRQISHLIIAGSSCSQANLAAWLQYTNRTFQTGL